jgi:hypothetical protein
VRFRNFTAVVTLIVLGALLLAGPAVAASTASLQATLSGANEVNAQGDPDQGDPDGSGTAQITPKVSKKKVCFDITVSDIALPATMAHIHKAPAGQNGPIVVILRAPDENGLSSGCTKAKSALIRDIKANPSDYYVNVHNSDFTGGALRGQLSAEV